MARNIRSNQLESRTNRLKFTIAKKPVFVRIGPGISLGYRRNKTAGTWVLRVADGRGGGKTSAIGHADDYDEPDGQHGDSLSPSIKSQSHGISATPTRRF
jgi:hypothetical protein